jgi:peptide/nickel transport system ATP-binding protein
MEHNNNVTLEARGLKIDFSKQKDSFFAPKSYLRAVNDVNFKMYQSHCLAVVGESGCGKSTIARAITKINHPSGGKILFRDQDIETIKSGADLREYRKDVQMVFQDPFGSLNPLHTIGYHLTRPLKIYHKLSGSELTDKLEALLTQVGLSPAKDILKKYPHQLSGGQRQRVFLAKTLAIGADVVLADEPTSMLDVSIRIGVLNLMNEMKHDMGKSFMYITHDIATARYFAEEILVLYSGHMVEWGDTEEVTQNAQHPYTQLLLAAVPDTSRSIHEKLPTYRSLEPQVWTPDSKGCPYAPRCPQALSVCSESSPVTKEIAPNHYLKCHLFS